MKENGTNKDLSREDWLRALRSSPQHAPEDQEDALSNRALRGLRYVENEEALRQSLNRLDEKLGKLARSRRGKRPSGLLFRLNNGMRFAAAVLVLCLSVTIGWLSIRHPSGQALYNGYFEPLASAIPRTGNVRGQENGAGLRAEALQDYENGSYAASVLKFRQYLQQETTDAAARLYYGIALLADNQPELARTELSRTLAETEGTLFQPAAAWYLALTHLRLNERRLAIRRLRELTQQTESRFYSKQAVNLLHDLKAGAGSR